MKRYLNAEKVLPQGLVDQILDHVAGTYLWVPSQRRARQRRRAEGIVQLRLDGRLPIKEIAERTMTSERRVYEVLAAYRRRYPNDPRLPRPFCHAKD